MNRVFDVMINKSREAVKNEQSVTHGASKKGAVFAESIEEKKLAGMYADAFDMIEVYL
jgi:hypothetical protein